MLPLFLFFGLLNYRKHKYSNLINQLHPTETGNIPQTNIQYHYFSELGTLFISGQGKLNDSNEPMPWEKFKKDIKTLSISNGITDIGQSNFEGCINIEKVKLPKTLKTIGNFAFNGCSKLVHISFPRSLVSIGKNAFSNCFNLKSVRFSEGIQLIDSNAFAYCSKLSFIVILASVSNVSPTAFAHCDQLKSIKHLRTQNSNAKQIMKKLQSVENIDSHPTEFSEPENSVHSDSNTTSYIIVGVICGAIVIFTIVAVILICYCRKRNQIIADECFEEEEEAPREADNANAGIDNSQSESN